MDLQHTDDVTVEPFDVVAMNQHQHYVIIIRLINTTSVDKLTM